MRSDPQGLLRRRTPHIVISARISFFHKSNLRKVEIPIQSEFLQNDFDAHFRDRQQLHWKQRFLHKQQQQHQ
jgi:hypothetical protein